MYARIIESHHPLGQFENWLLCSVIWLMDFGTDYANPEPKGYNS
jgi:hypothetical protein